MTFYLQGTPQIPEARGAPILSSNSIKIARAFKNWNKAR